MKWSYHIKSKSNFLSTSAILTLIRKFALSSSTAFDFSSLLVTSAAMSLFSQLQALGSADSKLAASLDSETKVEPAPKDLAQLRAELLAQRMLPLTQYRTEFALKTSLPKVKAEGSSPAPIPVPLQPGESQCEYERLFQQWLRRRNVQRSDLRDDPAKERIYRFAYANQRAQGVPEACDTKTRTPWLQAAKAPPASQHPVPPASVAHVHESKPCELKPPARNASAADFISAYASCYCTLCVRRWITLLTNRIDTLEAGLRELKVGAIPSETAALVESSSQTGDDKAAVELVPQVPKNRSLSSTKDPFKEQMMTQYAGFNKTVLTTENAIVELMCHSHQSIEDGVKRLLQQQAQVQQLRASVRQEIENRDAVVAAFMVYSWSDRHQELQSKIANLSSLDIPHLQQVIHAKCGAFAAQSQEKEAQLLKLKLQIHQLAVEGEKTSDLDAPYMDEIQRLNEMVSATEAALETLETEQTAAFTQLFEFSVQIRTLAKAMLESLL